MNEEMLIGLVGHYEFLYNTSHPKYKDSTKKNAAWNEISQVLNQPARTCKYRWQYLRAQYSTALNYRKKWMNYQPSAKFKKWKYEDEISFLNKYLRGKKPKAILNEDVQNVDDEIVTNSDYDGNSEFKSERGEIDSVENIEQFNIVAMDPLNFDHSPLHLPGSKTVQKNTQKCIASQPSQSSNVTTNYPEEPQREHKEPESNHDQMDLFFLGLSNTVKSFSPYLQAIAKNKTFNVVSELEIQQLAPGKSNTATETSTIPQTTNWPTRRERSSSNESVKVENAQYVD